MSGILVRPMDLPTIGDLDAPVKSLFDELDAVMGNATPQVIAGVHEWLINSPVRRRDYGAFEPAELEHPLSPYAINASSESFSDGRSLSEQAVLKKLLLDPRWSKYDLSPGDFVDCLIAIHRLLGCGGRLRRTPVRSGADRYGDFVVYPACAEFEVALQKIHLHWEMHSKEQPTFSATVAMVALMNLHPFDDGNGRVARIFFHWVCGRGRALQPYLPLYELSALSSCGYLIRLREAQYFGHWQSLASFLLLAAARLFSSRDGLISVE